MALSTGAIVMFLIGAIVLWGGSAYFLRLAIKKKGLD